jgi:hypothetical protein
VFTLLLCDLGGTRQSGGASAPSRAEVREFKRVAREREPARPFSISLAADRPA